MYLVLAAVLLLQSSSKSHGSAANFLNKATFQNSILRSPHFVLFYAPWCGHCKRLLTSWNQLAEKTYEQDERNKVKIAKVNCMEDTALCSEQNIQAYPTMKLFHKGAVRRFDGRRGIPEFEIFIDKVLRQVVDVEEVEGLVTLTAENFDNHIKSGLHFVEFFAPWCVHCKHFEPTWKAVAKHFEKNADITICKMDCTVESSKCQELKITGFPMLKLYKDGEEVDHYNSERTMKTLLSYINNNLNHYGRTVDGDLKQEQEQMHDLQQNDDIEDMVELHPVVDLLDITFDTVLEDTTFVKFYVPWCKYCQHLKPTWEALGKRCQRAGGPIIARIDCSKFPETCEKHKVTLYPTLVLFKEGHRFDYNEDRDLESLYKFAKGYHDEL